MPEYDFLNVPESHVYVTKYFNESNYLQANEGNIDPQHLSYLHKFVKDDPDHPVVAGTTTSSNSFFGQDVAPQIEIEDTDYGLRIFSVRTPSEEQKYVRITNFIFPNASLFGVVHHHVPIDDTLYWKFRITFVWPILWTRSGCKPRMPRKSALITGIAGRKRIASCRTGMR